ncbi:MAG: efflux RND transporter periplasmic adaptor subunit [Cyanophyceae cyanobacterium]
MFKIRSRLSWQTFSNLAAVRKPDGRGVQHLSRTKTLSAALFLVFAAACGRQAPEAQEPQAVPVALQTLEPATVIDSTEFVGSLEAQERVQVAPRVDGRIVSIAVEEGEPVSRGQLLVQLQLEREQATVNARTSEINAQRANLRNAEAQLRAAEAEREQTAAEVEQRRAELASAEADLQGTAADLELAQSELERTEFLVEEGAQAQQQLDQRTRDRTTAASARNSAQKVRDSAQGALNAAAQSLRAAQQRVEAARATVEQERANLSQAVAEREVSEQDLQFNRIVAPIAGIVGDILPKAGDYVESGEEITSLIQNNVLSLNINVPLQEAPRLRVGLPVEIIDNQGEVATRGEISFVSPRVNQNAQAVLAKATFSNNGSLRDDQFVRARVIWDQEPGVLVPTTSIFRIGGQDFVFVAEQQEVEPEAEAPNSETTKTDPTNEASTQLVAQQQVVELGDIQGQKYQVISGVEAGDRVVVSGILNLSDGVPITEEALQSEN